MGAILLLVVLGAGAYLRYRLLLADAFFADLELTQGAFGAAARDLPRQSPVVAAARHRRALDLETQARWWRRGSLAFAAGAVLLAGRGVWIRRARRLKEPA